MFAAIDPIYIVLPLGAFVGGVVSGLAGFAYALVVIGLWLQFAPPSVVGPLLVLNSLSSQLWAMARLRRAFDLARAWPFLVTGGFGVPVGVQLLTMIAPGPLKLSLGIMMTLYSAIMLRMKPDVFLKVNSRIPDMIVGFIGGVMNGLAGLGGVFPSMWVALRGFNKDEQRAVFQPYVLLLQTLAFASFLVAGKIDEHLLTLAALCVPATLCGTFLGLKLYARVNDRQFKRIVLTVVGLSGLVLVVQAMAG